MLLYQHSKGELQTSFTVQKYILQVRIAYPSDFK
jgi:hypothetical protein